MTTVASKRDDVRRAAPAVTEAGRIRSGWTPWVTAARYAALFVLVVLFLMPVYVMVVTSLKDPAEVSVPGMWELPRSLSLDSFQTVWERPEIRNGLRNSVILSVPASIISSLLGAANGFVLAKWRFPGADVVFPLILFGMFIPYQAVLIPLTRFMTDLNLRGGADPTEGLLGLTIIHIVYGLPITTLIFRTYFAGISDEIIESSKVDGAGMLRTFFFVALPVAPPAFAVSIIWQFTSAWNDFLFGFVMTARGGWPVTIGLNNIANVQTIPFNQAMAAALLASLPTLVVYVLLGRFFLRGLMAGALKG
ncbi:MAG TPA: carbohydrate ABC transporter permease [Natronosporangium sp.]|nr:carbohydrate ABC transporter permease [Natronosporangium sp.]